MERDTSDNSTSAAPDVKFLRKVLSVLLLLTLWSGVTTLVLAPATLDGASRVSEIAAIE